MAPPSSPKKKPKPPPKKKQSSSTKKKSAPNKKKPSALEAQQALIEKDFGEDVQATKDVNQMEKDVLPVYTNIPTLFFGTKSSSQYWDWSIHINWIEFEKLVSNNREELESSLYPGYHKIIKLFDSLVAIDEEKTKTLSPPDLRDKFWKMSRRVLICPRCFKNKSQSLSDSVMVCSHDKASNIYQHIKGHHKDLYDTIQAGGSILGPNPKPPPSNQKKLSGFKAPVQPRKQATKELQRLMYEFINDCCLPAVTVEKPQFRALLKYAFDNGSQLKDSRAEAMSRREITQIRVSSYQEFIDVVSDLARKVRAEYRRLCQHEIPFATVCHDIWQARKHDVLGVTIMLCDPRNCVIYRIPIGLAETQGHAAVDVAALTHSLLKAVGFRPSDLCATVNDNTSAAVLAGKYIVGEHASKGKCDMHRAELVLKHATGLIQRYQNKTLIDSFPAFVDAWQVAKEFASYLCSRKAYHRFEKFKSVVSSLGWVVVSIPLPNDTRVGGCVLSMETLLRILYPMKEYASKAVESDPHFITLFNKIDWTLISQFEGILHPLRGVSLSLQTDDPGSGSASLLEIYTCRFLIKHMRTGVVGCLPTNLNYGQQWDASITMKELDEKKRKKVKFEKLEKGPRDLIRRILKEYDSYLTNKDEDGLKAMCANPLLVNVYEEHLVELGAYNEDEVKEIRRLFVEDMVKQFTNKKVSQIGALIAKQGNMAVSNKNTATDTTSTARTVHATASNATTGGKATANNDSDSDSDTYVPLNPFEKIRRSRELKKQARLQLSGTAVMGGQEAEIVAALRKVCTEAFDEYRSMCSKKVEHQWDTVIQNYPTKQLDKDSEKWTDDETNEFLEYCSEHNFLKVGKYFDVMKWWDDNKGDYPYVFVSAIIWLTKPATNAFQERIFSLGTWFSQNKLMSNLLKKHFEMRTMDCLTRELRREIQQRESELEAAKRNKTKGSTLSKYVDKRRLESEKGDGTADKEIEVVEKADETLNEESASQQKTAVRTKSIQTATEGFKKYVRAAKFPESGPISKVSEDPTLEMTYYPLSDDDEPDVKQRATASGKKGQRSPTTEEADGKPPAINKKANNEAPAKPKQWNRVVYTRVNGKPTLDDADSVIYSLGTAESMDEDSDCAMNQVVRDIVKNPEKVVVLESLAGSSDEIPLEVEVVNESKGGEKRKTVSSDSKQSRKKQKTKQTTMTVAVRTSPPRRAKEKSRNTPPSAKLVRSDAAKGSGSKNKAKKTRGKSKEITQSKEDAHSLVEEDTPGDPHNDHGTDKDNNDSEDDEERNQDGHEGVDVEEINGDEGDEYDSNNENDVGESMEEQEEDFAVDEGDECDESDEQGDEEGDVEGDDENE